MADDDEGEEEVEEQGGEGAEEAEGGRQDAGERKAPERRVDPPQSRVASDLMRQYGYGREILADDGDIRVQFLPSWEHRTGPICGPSRTLSWHSGTGT